MNVMTDYEEIAKLTSRRDECLSIIDEKSERWFELLEKQGA